MYKSPKNSNQLSPQDSQLDSLIDRIKNELSHSSIENFENTKKLSIETTFKHVASAKPNDIDTQISDLECLIKNLQEEINGLGHSAERRVEDQAYKNLIKNKEPDQKSYQPETDLSGNPKHVFPIMIRDISMNFSNHLNNDLKSGGEVVGIPNTFSEIRRNFDILWGNECDELPAVYTNEWGNIEKENEIAASIDELTSESRVQIHDLNIFNVKNKLNDPENEMK